METKKVFYSEGPLRIICGDAGTFQLGVPKDVPIHLADVLLRKGIVKEWSSLENEVKKKK